MELLRTHGPQRTSYSSANRFGLSKETSSTIVTCTKAEFDMMPTRVVQDLFKTRHILVTHVGRENRQFDKKTLSQLGDWVTPVTIHG